MSEKPKFDPSKHLLPYVEERKPSFNTGSSSQRPQSYSRSPAASQGAHNPNGWLPQEKIVHSPRTSSNQRYGHSSPYPLPLLSTPPPSVRKDTGDEALAKKLLQILESEREAARKAELDDMELARLMQNQENQIGNRHEPFVEDYSSAIHHTSTEISQSLMDHSEFSQEYQDAVLARAIMEAETRSSTGPSRPVPNGPSSLPHATEPVASHNDDLELARMMQAKENRDTGVLTRDPTFESSDLNSDALSRLAIITRVQDEDVTLSRICNQSVRNDVQHKKTSTNGVHERQPSADCSESLLGTYPSSAADIFLRTSQGNNFNSQQDNYTGSPDTNESFYSDDQGKPLTTIRSSSPAEALGVSADVHTRSSVDSCGTSPAKMQSKSPAGVHNRSSVDLHRTSQTGMPGKIQPDIQERLSLDMNGRPPVDMHGRPPRDKGRVNCAEEDGIYSSLSTHLGKVDSGHPSSRRRAHLSFNDQILDTRRGGISNASIPNRTWQHSHLAGLGGSMQGFNDNSTLASSKPSPRSLSAPPQGRRKTKNSKPKRSLFNKLYSLVSGGRAKKQPPPTPVASVPLPQLNPPVTRQTPGPSPQVHSPVTRQTPGPLPHSVSINRTLPMAISPQPEVGGAKPRKRTPVPFNRGKPQAVLPRCEVCSQVALSYLQTLDKKYHPECFKCMGCHEVIDPSGPFAFSTGDSGDKYPLHRRCYAELFGIKCAVCRESIPTGPDGKVSYVKHPFFDSEQMCPSHAINPGRRCTGCHRFEPDGTGFADLGDADRCVCFSCCRSVVVDSEGAKPLWDRVIYFFEHVLNLPVWAEMREVPVLIVGYDALNDHIANSAHSGSSQIMTRGLCLSEHQSGRSIPVPRIRFDRQNRSFRPSDVESKGYTYFQVPDASKINPESSVTAILCLSGLPSDLTASVLAHEATHAWFKLHPNFDIADPISMQVEEGCCQLVAMLFLNDGLDSASTEHDDNGPSDEKLRQYFKFSIETDEHEIYGAGYRMAAKAHASIGIEALLSHVVMYKDIPDV